LLEDFFKKLNIFVNILEHRNLSLSFKTMDWRFHVFLGTEKTC